MKKIIFLFITSSIMLTSCQKLPDGKSYLEAEKDLTKILEAQNPYDDAFVESIVITHKPDTKGESITVNLNCYNHTEIGQDFTVVRDTILDYSLKNNYDLYSLEINTRDSNYASAYWGSYDLESGFYLDLINKISLDNVTLEELTSSDIDSLAKDTIEVQKDIKGRGLSDSDRSEPQYVGISGYVVVGYKQESDLERSESFTETPWSIPTISVLNNKSLNHKTEVTVTAQDLKDEGWGRYTGKLTVEIADTKEKAIIDVNNFITKPYWTYDDLEEAADVGFYIAEYNNKSSKYPVDRNNRKVILENGTKVLVVGLTGSYTGSEKPDQTKNPIEAIVYKEWAYGYGGVEVFFNPKDLTIIY